MTASREPLDKSVLHEDEEQHQADPDPADWMLLRFSEQGRHKEEKADHKERHEPRSFARRSLDGRRDSPGNREPCLSRNAPPSEYRQHDRDGEEPGRQGGHHQGHPLTGTQRPPSAARPPLRSGHSGGHFTGCEISGAVDP